MKEQFPTQDWYLIASTAKTSQDFVNSTWVHETHIIGHRCYPFLPTDPAKSTKDIVADIDTILKNTLETKDNFYLKYAN